MKKEITVHFLKAYHRYAVARKEERERVLELLKEDPQTEEDDDVPCVLSMMMIGRREDRQNHGSACPLLPFLS